LFGNAITVFIHGYQYIPITIHSTRDIILG